jgi:hypothetical protein
MNRFTFVDTGFETMHMSPFLNVIGAQAQHIRHIGLYFPALFLPGPEVSQFLDVQAKAGVKTLELFINAEKRDCQRYTAISTLDLITADAWIRSLGGIEKILLTTKRNFYGEYLLWPSMDSYAEARGLGWHINEREYHKLEFWIDSVSPEDTTDELAVYESVKTDSARELEELEFHHHPLRSPVPSAFLFG